MTEQEVLDAIKKTIREQMQTFGYEIGDYDDNHALARIGSACSTTTVLKVRDGVSEPSSVPPVVNIGRREAQEATPANSADAQKYTATTTQTAAALGVCESALRRIAKKPGFPVALMINPRVIRYDLEAVKAFYFRHPSGAKLG